jgi:Flp pilus assembly protein TadG
MTRLIRSLHKLGSDQRGAAFTEALIAFPVLIVGFLGLYMLTFVLAGHLIVMRAADAAARAAIVILPGDPIYYADGSMEKAQRVKMAAHLALLPSGHLALSDVKYSQASGFAPLTAEVRARFDCSPFLTSLLCGADRSLSLHAAATLPYQQGHQDR